MRFATFTLFAAVLFSLAAPGLHAGDKAPSKKKRILVITESKGFVHSVVNRKGQPQCLVEKVLTELGDKTGIWEAVCSQDSRKEITAENLKNFDAVFFYTTGSLPLSEQQKADLLAFIRSGKGFAGSHCATDTFYNWKEYGEMIGGYFDGHPWHGCASMARGRGRVFYTALGHREEVWNDPRFQQHIIGGFRWILGLEQGNAAPSRTIPKE